MVLRVEWKQTRSSLSTWHWSSESQPSWRCFSFTRSPTLTWRSCVASARREEVEVFPVPGVPVIRTFGFCLVPTILFSMLPSSAWSWRRQFSLLWSYTSFWPFKDINITFPFFLSKCMALGFLRISIAMITSFFLKLHISIPSLNINHHYLHKMIWWTKLFYLHPYELSYRNISCNRLFCKLWNGGK